MPVNKPAHYRLTPKALADLEEIWLYSAETWSVEQADRYVDDLERVFELLVAIPAMTRERVEFDPPVRIHAHGNHLIVYTIEGDHIVIVPILGNGQDWHAIIAAIDG